MRQKAQQKVYTVWLKFEAGLERSVKVKASSKETAEKRALKRNPAAIGVKADA